MRRAVIFLLTVAAALGCAIRGQGRDLPRYTQARLDSLLTAGFTQGYYPGAQLIIGERGKVLYEKCVGYLDTARTAPVTPQTVYDIASLTKIVATTFAVMKLYDERRIDINAPLGKYIKHYDGTDIADIPVSQLLTHTSGMPYFAIYPLLFRNADGGSMTSATLDEELYPLLVDRSCYLCANMVADEKYVSFVPVEGWRRAGEYLYVNPEVDALVQSAIVRYYKPERRGTYRYSDTNFHILRQIVEKISGQSLEGYTRTLFDRLGMEDTGYRPLEWISQEYIAPTEYDFLMQRGQIWGFPHDEWAAVSADAVQGHAGIFSNVGDLAHYCDMLLSMGRYGGERIISRETINLFTSSPLAEEPKKVYRGLGFDKREPGTALGDGYGHTGFTGTFIWIDPSRDLYIVFLSNRVHPSRLNTGLSDSSLRTVLWQTARAVRPVVNY